MRKIQYTDDCRFPVAPIIFASTLSEADLFVPGNDNGWVIQRSYRLPSTGEFFTPYHVYERPLLNAGVDIIEVSKQESKKVFSALYDQWRTQRGATSSITEMVMSPAYLKIIGLGPPAIPLILRRMEDEGAEPDMWFVALQILTGADPVTDEIRGDFPAMARRWLTWAKVAGYEW